jgi:GNAT superfamily N-acetyltransferase
MNRYLEEHFSETIQREQILNPFNKIFIVWNNLKPIGYAHLRMSEDSNNQRVKLVRFYVEQEWHSKGVAHLMMGACLDWSCKQGFREIWLGVWEKNNRAQAFYRKWGFNQTGSNPFQFGTDVHLDYTFSRKISERDEGKFKQMNLNLA